MVEWWEALDSLSRIFAAMAVPATILLLIQTIFMLTGFFGGGELLDGDAGGDLAGGGSGGGLALFTVKGITAFFSVGGWAGLAAIELGFAPAFAVIIAAAPAVGAFFGIAYLMKFLISLQQYGNFSPESAVGKLAKVYLPIPGAHSGKGKISIIAGERYMEIDAFTNEEERLSTGETVKVIEVIDENTLLVERI